MRPTKLTMTAFGPYAGVQEIDFGQLGGRNLFVISGNTGSGKTTILDAICYALYGKASGRDRDGESLRSHFASDDVLTSIELEFMLNAKTYWVRRVPKQLKKRIRGSGYTDQNAEAEFRCLSDSSGQLVCGITEVNSKLVDILGITYEQFKQIILIPQGEFRELLTADSRTREDILQKIFGTEGFRQVQDILKSKADAIEQEVATIKIRLKDALKTIDAAGSPELCVLLSAEHNNVAAIIAETERAIDSDVAESTAVQREVNGVETAIKDKQQELFAAELDNQKLDAKEAAQTNLDKLLSLRSAVDMQQIELAQARQAISVTGAEDNFTSRCGEVESRKQASADTARRVLASEETLTAAKEKYRLEAAKEAGRNQLLIEQSRLEELKGKLTDWTVKQSSLRVLEAELERKSRVLDDTKRVVQEVKESRTQCQKELDIAKEAGQQQTVKSLEQERLRQVFIKLETLQAENEQLVALRQLFLQLKREEIQANQALEKAQMEYDNAQALFLAGQAGLLAARLQPGAACPVCGSREHPQPAAATSSVPSETFIRELMQQVKDKRDSYDAIKPEFDRVRADGEGKRQLVAKLLAELDAFFAEDICQLDSEAITLFVAVQLPEWKRRLNDISKEINALKASSDKIAALADSLRQKESDLNRAESELALLNQSYPVLFGQAQAAKESVAALAQELPPAIRSLDALEAALAQVAQQYAKMRHDLELAEAEYRKAELEQAQAVAAKDAAAKALQEALNQQAAAEQKFITAIREAGFADEGEYRKAKLTAGAIAELDKAINDYYAKLRSAQDNFDQAVKSVEGITRVDTSLLRTEHTKLEGRKLELYEIRTAYISRKLRNQHALENIVALSGQLTTKEEANLQIGHLAKIAKGDNTQKLSFERYVLAAFFNDIIEAANIRLRKMTSGRYYMRRIEEKGKGGGQSGLEIEVFDYYTGRARHVKVLSGGESFKASLSLALGLADVVQSYAGGISIETMLVDEGFGSLDPESLDSAINTLIELQHTGRLVGIISHVPELKVSVDARLEIEAHKDGSTATFHIL